SDVPRFVGRDDAVRRLDALLASVEAGRAGVAPIVIAALGGSGGIGKTALAVHWARRVADRFGGGQLYLNLRGYGPQPPVSADTALESLLRSLDVPPERIPASLDGRSALLRSTLAGRRSLLVLDNARDADQVRPLLPGSDTLVLVTSRSHLRALSAREGAHRISLDQLTAAESVALLRGADRAYPEAVLAELAELCDHLPLALVIVAEQLRRSGADPATLLAELRDEQERLDVLDAGEALSDVRAVFSWSYHAWEPELARMFRLLALHPGTDISVPAAAALAGVPVPVAGRLLDRLVGASQLRQPRPGRYEQHDLIRAYAAELASTDPDRDAAVRRVLDWYLRTVAHAYVATGANPLGVELPSPEPAVVPLSFGDPGAAGRWCREEFRSLMSGVRLAADHGVHEVACWLAHAALRLSSAYGESSSAEQDTTFRLGLDSARLAGNRRGEALLTKSRGFELARRRDPDGALRASRDALAIAQEIGDRQLEASLLGDIGGLHSEWGTPADAIDHHRRSRAINEEIGSDAGCAKDLNNLGYAYVLADRYDEAVETSKRSLELARRLGAHVVQGIALETLGQAYQGAGDLHAALTSYQEAIAVFGRLGHGNAQAGTMIHLGQVYHDAGRPALAREVWTEALALLDNADASKADTLRRLLRELAAAAGGAKSAPELQPGTG
ncbi:MAG: ATP-binding protein, partial [Micromonosporaceae bacterium]